MTREELLETIRDFFEDASRSTDETLECLQDALEDIKMFIETLES